MKTIVGISLVIFVVVGMFNPPDQSIYISHLYIYDAKFPQISKCGGDYDCEAALDKAWAEAMAWDKLIDERVYP